MRAAMEFRTAVGENTSVSISAIDGGGALLPCFHGDDDDDDKVLRCEFSNIRASFSKLSGSRPYFSYRIAVNSLH
ncbi:hypothetical protein LSM04_002229 [Trypanosoma melophagium]|uniref:uncharacterized protein n=1 Tax=Trypanosoma melophagium TaxID=715481 RepID=UPI00351A991A|nr:hypothetical protein LSM04_002229 [Trypanosoma melophagium]